MIRSASVRRSLLAFQAVLVLSTDLGAQARPATTAPPVVRRFIPVEWVPLPEIDPEQAGILDPRFAFAAGDTLVILDYAGPSVASLLSNGRLAWRAGRQGRGPGEFINPTSIARGPDGVFWVPDPPNHRIIRIDPRGRILTTTTVGRQITHVVPFAADRALVTGVLGDSLYAIIDSTGRMIDVVPMPLELRQVGPIVRVSRPYGGRGGIGLAFRWSGRYLFADLQGDSVAWVDGPEPLPFPRMIQGDRTVDGRQIRFSRPDPQAKLATVDAVLMGGDTLAARFGGHTADAGRILDLYSIRQRRYLGSLRLPEAGESFTFSAGILTVLSLDPVPTFKRWRLGALTR